VDRHLKTGGCSFARCVIMCDGSVIPASTSNFKIGKWLDQVQARKMSILMAEFSVQGTHISIIQSTTRLGLDDFKMESVVKYG
jgi:hypothetical protein